MNKILFFICFFALAALQMWAGGPIEPQSKLTFGWHINDTLGDIADLKFMPDEDHFLVSSVGYFEIRNSATGSLEQKFPSSIGGYFQFTPDSQRIVMANGALMVLLNLSDFKEINHYDIDNEGYVTYVKAMAVDPDPHRPYVYIIISRERDNPSLILRQLVVLNYETMKQVADLTINGDRTVTYSQLAISKDGKYLSAINDGIKVYSYLYLWDLNTMKLLKKVELASNYYGQSYVVATDLKFSEINYNKIYYSGVFSPTYNKSNNGFFSYDINTNIMDSSLSRFHTNIWQGKFVLFDNEERVAIIDGLSFGVINLYSKNVENIIQTDHIDSLTGFRCEKLIVSGKNKLFIGECVQNLTQLSYESETRIIDNEPIIQVIYPNPTTNNITINNNCIMPQIEYKILNSYGLMLIDTKIQNTNNVLQLDFSHYPAGLYFIQLNCGQDIRTYKVIKE